MNLTDQEKRAMQRMENSITATPTQAQIEAAAEALYRNAGAPTETLARAALTAAAEVPYGANVSDRRDKGREGPTPTQAQIEAARLAIVKYLAEHGHTFADSECACWGPSTLYPQQIAEVAINAAAEVGGLIQAQIDKAHSVWKEQAAAMNNEVAATIERCAQVVDYLATKAKQRDDDVAWLVLSRAVAAIRALKEKL